MKVNRLWQFYFACVVMVIEIGCYSSQQSELYDTIKKIYDREVILPLEHSNDSLLFNPKLVVYIDSSECSMCRVRNLIFWEEKIKIYMNINPKLEFLFIIYPKPEVAFEVEAFAEELELKNIYFDKFGEFIQENSFLKNDKRFHVLLLDKNNKIKMVGSPINNAKLDKLYKRQLKLI